MGWERVGKGWEGGKGWEEVNETGRRGLWMRWMKMER